MSFLIPRGQSSNAAIFANSTARTRSRAGEHVVEPLPWRVFVTPIRTALILPRFPAHSVIGRYGPPSLRTRNMRVATRLFEPVDSHYAVDSVDSRR